MNKQYIILIYLLAFAVSAVISAPAFASQGKNVFINKCGSCHKSGGEAAAFAPTKYASTQWDRFFQRNKHKRKKDISAEVTEADIAAVKIYLINHAADSDQPEAVGLR